MASIRKMDRLDCVSTDGTSSSVGSSEGGGVVALVSVSCGRLGSSQAALSLGMGCATSVLLLDVVLVALEALGALEVGSSVALAPVVLGVKMREELVALGCLSDGVDV